MAVGDDDDVIEHAVVQIGSELEKGFDKKVQTKVDAALKGVFGNVKLTAVATGFAASARKALKTVPQPEFKVKLVADATGFNRSVNAALKAYAASHDTPTYKVRLVADASGLNGSVASAGRAGRRIVNALGAAIGDGLDDVDKDVDGKTKGIFKRIEDSELLLADTINRKIADKLNKAFLLPKSSSLPLSQYGRQVRDQGELIEKTHRQVLDSIDADEKKQNAKSADNAAQLFKRVDGSSRVMAETINQRISKSLHDAFLIPSDSSSKLSAVGALQDAERKATQITEQETAKRARLVEQEAARRKKAYRDFGRGSQLIDFGARGIRPMNLLYSIVAGLTPALFAMGSSALQASTAVAALGAAGIGAALGLGGLVIAFKGITDLWALRKTVQSEADQDAANSAQTAVANAQAQLQANNSLLDSQHALLDAENDLHQARLDARDDLIDLKQKVADLQNQQKEDTLTLAEKEVARAKVQANYFASALEKARANQDVASARLSLSDTKTDLAQQQPKLADAVKKGVENSDKVKDAKEKIRQARERLEEAKLAKANQALGGSAGKASTAQAQLNKMLADASPALRELYHWLDKNQQMFTNWQNQLQQHFLPGFTDFLKITTTPPKGGESTFQFFADQASELGDILSDQLRDYAKWTNSPLFREKFATIQENNAKGFKILGEALKPFSEALLTILEKASPLFPKMATGLKNFATWLDRVIGTADKNGGLKKYFDEVAEAGSHWIDLFKNVARLLGNIFKQSMPAGDSLMERLSDFIGEMADWAGSAGGQQKIKDFFDFFKNLPYGDIFKFFAQSTAFFLSWRLLKYATGSPMQLFFLAWGTFAASHPELAAKYLGDITDKVGALLGFFADNAAATASAIGLFAAIKGAKTLGLNISIPGINAIKKKLESAFGGGETTGTMTVKAGVVNVYGGAGTPIPGKTSKTSSPILTGGGLTTAAILAYLFGSQGIDNASSGKGFGQDVTDFLKDPSWGGLAKSLEIFSPAYWVTYGITSLKKSGVLSSFFSTVMPMMISGGKASSWPAFGNMFGDAFAEIGKQIPGGLAKGIVISGAIIWGQITRFVDGVVDFFKRLFGIHSPSTVFAAMGSDLVSGLWQGFVDKWTGLLDTVTTWISSNITAPLSTAFANSGLAIRSAFTGAFTSLTSKLAAPVKAALGWIDKYMITPLNVLLGGLGITPIKLIGTTANASSDTGTTAGTIIGDVGSDIGSIIKKADGGVVPGFSPNSKADNIPAWLTANEYVQPVDAVKHYGVDFMEAVRTRRYQPGYAEGGLVAGLLKSQGANLATNVAYGALKGLSLKDMLAKVVAKAASAVGGLFGGDTSGGKVVGDQNVAETAEATARSMGATEKQLVALISAGISESTLRNINYGDRDSVGFLQQRPSQGWGSVDQLMNVAYATRKFIEAAKRIDNPGYSAGVLAYKVQKPDPKYYQRYIDNVPDAVAVLNRAAPFLSGYGQGGGGGSLGDGDVSAVSGIQPGSTAVQPTKASLIDFGHWLQSKGYTVSENPAFGRVGKHGDNSKHYVGRALDVNHGAGTSAAEQSALAKVVPEAHRRGFRTIFMYPGHYNHLHVDFAKGGLVPNMSKLRTAKYDNGGGLPPGYTLAFNGTGQTETVRTAKQEQQLTANRLDKRDIALLAANIAAANNQVIHMDGRKVAETANAYTYLPAGV